MHRNIRPNLFLYIHLPLTLCDLHEVTVVLTVRVIGIFTNSITKTTCLPMPNITFRNFFIDYVLFMMWYRELFNWIFRSMIRILISLLKSKIPHPHTEQWLLLIALSYHFEHHRMQLFSFFN